MKKHYKGHIKILVTDNTDEIGIPLIKILHEFERIKADHLKSVEALAEYDRQATNAVTVDANISDLTNREVLIAVRELNRARISIILTNDPEMRRVCIRSGAHCFLGKSNQFERVSQMIEVLEEV